MSEEGKISEQPPKISQEIEVGIVDSIDTKTPYVDLVQKERTPKRGDKGKSIAEKNPSSSKGKYLMEHIPRWLRKEFIRNKKHKFISKEEDRMELIEVLRKSKSSPKDV